ncbi:hypothetical protein LCGC14_0950390 [marine sediment metagenome]|uniref:Uncharacterized protein n=1 Tax=marine sediment metagenome TaxID=412755 RepID=A0A0F9NHI4_9ZZZZ
MSDQCIICQKEVPDYEPEMCCSGQECACLGRPIEPCVCSQECDKAAHDYIGLPFDERRKRAGIKLNGGIEKLEVKDDSSERNLFTG